MKAALVILVASAFIAGCATPRGNRTSLETGPDHDVLFDIRRIQDLTGEIDRVTLNYAAGDRTARLRATYRWSMFRWRRHRNINVPASSLQRLLDAARRGGLAELAGRGRTCEDCLFYSGTFVIDDRRAHRLWLSHEDMPADFAHSLWSLARLREDRR